MSWKVVVYICKIRERIWRTEGHAGVVDTLTEALGTKDVRLKRRCMACLGELLFYIAAMPADARDAACWDIQDATLSAVIGLLEPAEDSTVQVPAASSLMVSSIQLRYMKFEHGLTTPC